MNLDFQPMTAEFPAERELLVIFFVAAKDQLAVSLARHHQFKERGPAPAMWTAWQFTCDGRQVPDEFIPIAWAELPAGELEEVVRTLARELREQLRAERAERSPVYAAARRVARPAIKRGAAHG